MNLCDRLSNWRPPSLGWIDLAPILIKSKNRALSEVVLHVKNENFCMESILHGCAVEFESNGSVSAIESAPAGDIYRESITFLQYPGILAVGPTTVMAHQDGLGCFLRMIIESPAASICREVVLVTSAERPLQSVLYDIVSDMTMTAGAGRWAGLCVSGDVIVGNPKPLCDSDEELLSSYLQPIINTEYKTAELVCEIQRVSAILALFAREAELASRRMASFRNLHRNPLLKDRRPRCFSYDWDADIPA